MPIPPVPPPTTDNATFISDVTIPDGTVLSPGQSFTKIWRMRNSGSSTWGSGYELVFIGGDQMGAPGAVSVPATAPGSTADISVSMTAPSGSGNYQGNWRMRNAQGVFFGDTVWVKITLQGSPPPGPDVPTADGIQVLSVDYPRSVTPGQTFRPSVRIKLLNGELRESRGDMLRHKSGGQFDAWPHVAVVGTVYAGHEYTFTFYQDNPMRAPDGEGTYDSVWQIWANGGWAGPEIHITFTVQQPQDLNQPPNRPSPTNENGGANDWHYSRDGSQVRLCGRHNGDPDGDAIVAYQFDVQGANTWNSGEVSTSCVTTSGLGPYGYEWRVRAKDNRGAWSDWSDPPWHFNIAEQQLSLDDFRFEPGSPSAAERVRVWTCLHGFGEVNIGLKIEANTATDGSASGDWYWIHHLGTFCYPQDDTSQWPNWETLPLEDGTHLIRATGFGPHGETIVKEANYTLLRRKPPPVQALFPIQEVKINSRTVTFRWNPAVRASEHQLLVSTENDPAQNSLLDVTLGGSAASYTHTFSQDHPRLRWRVIARNELGESEATNEFGIDRTAPSSAVSPLPATTHETKFTVSWSGNDNLAGLRWYDVQVRDSERGEWTDWQTGVDSTAAIFPGHPGHTYCFRARALDNAGNLESYPEGDGDTCTQVDPGAAPPTSWWDPDYAFKRNLLILNNDSQSLPAGYPMHLHFDNGTIPTASELYNASQSGTKGDDFRIVYDNQTELPRFVQTFSSDRIDIWFNLQAGIGPSPGSDSGSYQLYHSNPNASSPPDDPNLVFSPTVDSNSIGLWRFSEGSGATLADSSGHGHTGSAQNMGWVEGKFGWAGLFNGISSVVNLGSANEFNLNTFAAEVWAYFTEVGGERSFFIKHADDGSLIYDANTDHEEIVLRLNGNSCNVRSGQKVETNRWYHLAWTYDGSTARVYINGGLMNSSFCGNPLRTGNSILWLGGDGKYNNKHIKGYIQLARMSNTARTSFPYGAFGVVLQEPSLAAGDAIEQPQLGTPDLAVGNLAAYNTADGTLVQAVVTNQGDGETCNGFWIDLYADHQPTGPGDLEGSVRYWVASPIEAGATISLTTVITDGAISGSGLAVQNDGLSSPDLLTEALTCLGFDGPDGLMEFFSMEEVSPDEITVCPDGEGGVERCCVQVLREEGHIIPFTMTNPTSVTFDGWRASTQPHVPDWDGNQAGVPPGGPWMVEGVTIRPWPEIPKETTQTLYAQADSTGVLSEPDKANNISPGIEVCLASADSYESDDTAATARLVSVGTTEIHNFDAAGDQDWLKFAARAGVAYTIRTGNLGTSGDTYLYLYDTDGTTLFAANDDYGGTLDSRIIWQAPADGAYYVMAKHWNPNVGGCGTSYDLSVTLLGDFEPNCIVDVVDIMQVASRWRSRVGDTNYDPTYDLDGDGDIDIVDIMLVVVHWGETCE